MWLWEQFQAGLRILDVGGDCVVLPEVSVGEIDGNEGCFDRCESI